MSQKSTYYTRTFVQDLRPLVKQMTITSSAVTVGVAAFLGWLLLGNFPVTNAVESDIYCLRSLRESLQDPYDYITSSWNFNNNTQGIICVFTGVSCWNDVENRVLSIELSDKGLKGQFPQGLENCTSLTTLDLSRNQLSGPLPLDIGKRLNFITVLDLSGNYFSGNIPPSIVSCQYISVLKLDNNGLRGLIPVKIGLMSRIKTFSVANNMLTGPVPNFSQADIPLESYVNNSGLCGYPLERCKVAWISDHVFRTLFVSGFMTGWAISTIFSLFFCVYFLQNIAVKEMIAKVGKTSMFNANERKQNPWWKATEIDYSLKLAKLEMYVTRISVVELANATANFSQENVIGIGKMGTMYKATLPNGWPLAVKLLFSSELEGRIVSELMTLGRLRHRRLVPLVSFCFENQSFLLVYKYMTNGNLRNWLNERKAGGEITAWSLRIKIAVGIAEGLAWFHQKHNFRAVHGSISSQCILLDDNFEPKISNFWEAKLFKPTDSASSWSSFEKGESVESHSGKKDVYCFGIVLLELVTAKDPEELPRFLENFVDTSRFGESFALSEVDKTLIGRGFDDEIYQFLEIAKNCVRSNPDQRPTMPQVHKTLAAFAQIYNYTSNS